MSNNNKAKKKKRKKKNHINEYNTILNIIRNEQKNNNMQIFLNNIININEISTEFCGIRINTFKELFNENIYNNSEKGSLFKFLNDIIDVLVNVRYSYNNKNEFINNKYFKTLQDTFEKCFPYNEGYTNILQNMKEETYSEIINIFDKICKVAKKEDSKYSFIEGDIFSDMKNRRTIQLELAKIFFNKIQNKLPNIELSDTEILLHNSLLLSLYSELLLLYFDNFPKSLSSNKTIYNQY